LLKTVDLQIPAAPSALSAMSGRSQSARSNAQDSAAEPESSDTESVKDGGKNTFAFWKATSDQAMNSPVMNLTGRSFAPDEPSNVHEIARHTSLLAPVLQARL
jgi:hypothetical protein